MQTADTYALYFSTHIGPFFGTVAEVTTAHAADYVRARLRVVQGTTVRKELSALRGLLSWLVEQGKMADAPLLPSVPKRAAGTAHKQGRREHTELSPSEVRKLLTALPERSPGGWPVRARFQVMYETTLRPETLHLLSVPENYRKGAAHLVLAAQDDKARHKRRVPLSAKARSALDRVCPESGPIFGRHKCRWFFEKAALSALPADKAATAHPYDLRAAGITHRIEAGAPLPGVQWLAGHKSIATTAKYVRASERAAQIAVSGRRRRPP